MAEYLPAQLERTHKPQIETESPTKKERAPAPHPLLSLQSRVGNQAVARMVQRSGEEEALQAKHDLTLQREDEGGEMEEEEAVQAKHDLTLQREDEGGEMEEEEAVQAKHDLTVQREDEGGEMEEEEAIQGKHDLAQRATEEQAQVGLEGGPVGANIENQINSMRGGGSAPPEGIRRQMEAATGSNLSGVRVHEGAEASGLNQQLTAKAFTTGNDIFLREDQSPQDSSLMAHEMAHVVQQSSGRTASGGEMSAGAANDPLEAEADSLASAVLSGQAQRHAEEVHA